MNKSTLFNVWAGDYDESIERGCTSFPFDGYYDVLAFIVSQLNRVNEVKVLDIGIGTGLVAKELARKGASLYGVDFSTQMLARSREKISDGHFELSDVGNNYLGRFSDQKFNYIISSYFFHHFTLNKKIELLKRLLEVNLLPNGKLVVADVGFEDKNSFQKAQKEFSHSWDDEEYYLCGEEVINELKNIGIESTYTQISSCAGVIVIS